MDKLYIYENTVCVRVADFIENGISDSDIIENAVFYAKEHHIPTVLFDTRDWFPDRAILFYTGAVFIVDGVKIKQADGVFDNIFRSEGFIVDENEPNGYPVDIKTVENFRLIGKNGASIEGPDVQPLLFNEALGEKKEPFGDIWGWRGFMVYFTCCKNFEFSGFTIRKTRTWAVSTERSSDGYMRDIFVYSSCPNGDGINLRNGCSRIALENIGGATSDDMIALNNCSVYDEFPLKTWKTYLYPLVASNIFITRGEARSDNDIHDIYINNVNGTSAVIFLARNGYKIYNIKVSNISDNKEGFERRNIAHMVGAYYKSGYGSESNDICLSDITIENVESNFAHSAVLFNDRVNNLIIKNITQNHPEGAALTACDEDDAVMINCTSASGIIRNSSKDWVNPMLKRK